MRGRLAVCLALLATYVLVCHALPSRILYKVQQGKEDALNISSRTGELPRAISRASHGAQAGNFTEAIAAFAAQVPRTAEYVAMSNARFAYELLGDDRVDAMIMIATHLTSAMGGNKADEMLMAMVTLLARQTETNPPRFVSHGADHSVRVMVAATSLLEHFPEVQVALRSHFTREHAHTLLEIAALMHDVGYADLASHEPKWVHSQYSGVAMQHLIDSSPLWEEYFAAMDDREDDDLLAEEVLLDSIVTHNFDKLMCDSPSPLPSACCTLFQGEPRERVYDVVDTGSEPLDFLLRIADNADFGRGRLTPQQQSPSFQLYLSLLYRDNGIRIARKQHADLVTFYEDDDEEQEEEEVEALEQASEEIANARNTARATYIMRLPELASQRELDPLVDTLVSSANEDSFLHFFSNWAVQRNEITKRTNGRYLLEVFLHEDLKSNGLAFGDHPGIGLFQVNRLAEAAAALSLDSSPLLHMIDVKLHQLEAGVHEVYEETHHLQSFTRAQYHNGSFLCGPREGKDCFMSQHLTLSPELCLDGDGSVVECAYNIEPNLTLPPLDWRYWPHEVPLSAPLTTELAWYEMSTWHSTGTNEDGSDPGAVVLILLTSVLCLVVVVFVFLSVTASGLLLASSNDS